MSNADVRDELAALQARVQARDVSIEAVGSSLERLAWSLVNVSEQDDAALRGWMNDIERIRFTLRHENQMPAVAEVLRQAMPLFDKLA